MKLKLLIISLFLSLSAWPQLENSLTDKEIDSVLSKLQAGAYFKQQYYNVATTLQYTDSLILGLNSEILLYKSNETNYRSIIIYKDSIITNKKSVLKLEKKKSNKKVIKIGVATLLVGVLIGIGM